MEKNQLFLSGRKGKALGLNPPVACGDSPPSSGALGIAESSPSLPRPPLLGAVALRSNDGGVKP